MKVVELYRFNLKLIVDATELLDYLDQAALDELKESCKRLHITANTKSKVILSFIIYVHIICREKIM